MTTKLQVGDRVRRTTRPNGPIPVGGEGTVVEQRVGSGYDAPDDAVKVTWSRSEGGQYNLVEYLEPVRPTKVGQYVREEGVDGVWRVYGRQAGDIPVYNLESTDDGRRRNRYPGFLVVVDYTTPEPAEPERPDHVAPWAVLNMQRDAGSMVTVWSWTWTSRAGDRLQAVAPGSMDASGKWRLYNYGPSGHVSTTYEYPLPPEPAEGSCPWPHNEDVPHHDVLNETKPELTPAQRMRALEPGEMIVAVLADWMEQVDATLARLEAAQGQAATVVNVNTAAEPRPLPRIRPGDTIQPDADPPIGTVVEDRDGDQHTLRSNGWHLTMFKGKRDPAGTDPWILDELAETFGPLRLVSLGSGA